ncbi:MAG: SDR family NAD(P)-dependent oxidoreductase [Pseudomonadota bacterium]
MRLLLGIILFYGRFGASFTRIGYRWRKRRFNAIGQALVGRHVVVTGASGGIGSAVVKGCLEHGASVTAIARNQQKLDALVPDGHPRLTTICADLAETNTVSDWVDAIADVGDVDVLVNNVGVMLHDYATNAAGIDRQFATNLLNPYLMTQALIERDILKADGAVVTVASGGMYMAPLTITKLATDAADQHDGTTAYAVQKRAQVVLTDYWQQRFGPTGRQFHVMHPGWVDTAGVQQSLPTFRKILRPLLRNAAEGADTIIWLAAAMPEAPQPVQIWFDRAARAVHAYGFTKGADSMASALIEYLNSYDTSEPSTSPT